MILGQCGKLFIRLLAIASGLALTTITAQAQNDPPTSGSSLPAPIATRQMYFSIPFRVDQAAELSRQPVAVQLLVSQDNGADWRFYTKALPNQKQIPFRTATDGEYWFAVRTVDRAGKMHPETIPGPGLRVIVDTAPPQMRLSAQ